MKTFNIKYKDYENLKLYINNNDIIKYSNILVQVFSGIGKKSVYRRSDKKFKIIDSTM